MLTRQQFASADNQQGTGLWTAWLAGLFDGEGSIGIYGRKVGKQRWTTYQVMCTLTNTSMVVLDKVILILKENDIPFFVQENQVQKGHNWKPRWQLKCSNYSRAKKFLEFILPWLVDKKQEAEITLEYINSRQAAMLKSHSEPLTDREFEIIERLQSLKQTRHLRD